MSIIKEPTLCKILRKSKKTYKVAYSFKKCNLIYLNLFFNYKKQICTEMNEVFNTNTLRKISICKKYHA